MSAAGSIELIEDPPARSVLTNCSPA